MSDIEHLPGAKVTGTMVRRLARHLQGVHKLTLKHTQAVDAVAAQLGFPNRHELANAQGRTLSQTGTPDSPALTPLQRLMTLYYASGAHQALTDLINFRVPPRIAREIKTFAARHDMSLSAVLREAFADLQAN